MGNFYCNTTVRGPSQREVADFLQGRGARAHVTPAIGGCVVVFDRNALELAGEDLWSSSEGAEPDEIDVAAELSRAFGCPAFWTMVHDDDIFAYQLFRDGIRIDAYNSRPDA